jgi:uncharacterized protein YqfB (UPF0267 family)
MMKKIPYILKRSAIIFSKEYSRFFHEDITVNQSPVTGIKSIVNDGLSNFNGNNKNFSLENIERIWNRKEIFFVVDWQMSDSF